MHTVKDFEQEYKKKNFFFSYYLLQELFYRGER